MNKLLTLQNKNAFTFIEIIISITIIVISATGISFFADVIFSGFKSVQLRANTMEQVEMFEEAFIDIKSNCNKIIFDDGDTLFNKKYGFDLIALRNEEKNFGRLIGAYDLINKKIIIGNSTLYSKYVPFILYLNQGDIENIYLNKEVFLQNIDFSKVIYYDTINLMKMAHNNILNTELNKIDLSISYEYFSDYYDIELKEITKYSNFKTIELSIIK